MSSPVWLWTIKQHGEQHFDRVPFMYTIAYALISIDPWRAKAGGNGTAGHALSLNIGPQGLLVLMDREPVIDQMMRITVPSPIPEISIPTMADVRWMRKVPLISDKAHPIFFVGLRFIM
jgi:hypothetical protein